MPVYKLVVAEKAKSKQSKQQTLPCAQCEIENPSDRPNDHTVAVTSGLHLQAQAVNWLTPLKWILLP